MTTYWGSRLGIAAAVLVLAALAYPADRAYGDEMDEEDCGAGDVVCRTNRICIPVIWGGCLYERTWHSYYKKPPEKCEVDTSGNADGDPEGDDLEGEWDDDAWNDQCIVIEDQDQ